MADIEKVIRAWECCNPFNRKCKECPYEKDCYHDGISRHMVADAIELLKAYYTVANEKPFQCKDCAYYRKAECPLDKTSLFYGVLNFSCSAGIRKNRAMFHDSPNVHVACGMMPSVFSRDDDD